MSFVILNFVYAVSGAKAAMFCTGIAKAQRRKDISLLIKHYRSFKISFPDACGANFVEKDVASSRLRVESTLSLVGVR